jgi:hypothetical protein
MGREALILSVEDRGPARGRKHDERGSEAVATPDGRYIVVRGRLWRRANPHLPEDERARLVRELMAGRRAVRAAKGRGSGDADALRAARAQVDAAKRGLGERGPPWWDDGAPDQNRRLARNTPYADWWAAIESATERGTGSGTGRG